MSSPEGPLLRIEGVTVAYRQGTAWLEAVREVSLEIAAGETVGLVGESGSGKSTLALAIMGYLAANGRVSQGTIAFDGRDLLALSPGEMRRVWGAQMALVPQDALSSLNPSIRIGEQLVEPLRLHLGLGRATAARRATEMLEGVRLADPDRVAASYPHQISGGMQQRVMIAMALSTRPRLLVLDEPTTALDVTTQAAILDLLRDLIGDHGASALYVSHNLSVVARTSDRVAVLYAGEMVEMAPTIELFRQPLHPYTRGLLDSIPRLGQSKHRAPLKAIPGEIPSPAARPGGCVFAPRCPLAIEVCRQRPPVEAPLPGRTIRCHRWPEIMSGAISDRQKQPAGAARRPGPNDSQPVLVAADVAVHFPLGRPLTDVLTGRPARQVRAVDGVSLTIPRGRTLGLVGESGSGKTTLARAVVGLVERTGGSLELLGMALPPSVDRRSREMLRHLQLVFQNPEEALNPYLTVGETLRRPFITLLKRAPDEADALVERLLAAVRLPGGYARRLPGELSGGEKQRVAIARAFACRPDLLLADEPVSALDVSVQATILNLLDELQQEHGLSILLISHDLAVVGYLADVIAIMYLGRLMEVAPAAALLEPPYHPYTEALLSAGPVADPAAGPQQIRLEGEIPSASAVPSGCPFHTRCPRFLGDICVTETPPWHTGKNGQRIYCHIPLTELAEMQPRVVAVEGDRSEGDGPLSARRNREGDWS